MNKAVILVLGLVVGLAAGLVIGHKAVPIDRGATNQSASMTMGAQVVAVKHKLPPDAELQTAVAALEALVSATQSGVNYQSYLDRKADTHVVIDRYANTRGQDAPLLLTFREALSLYDDVGDLWTACLTERGCISGLIDLDSGPENITAILLHQPGLRSLGNPVRREDAISYLWGEAAKVVASARAAI
jgi:hypothetical protein